MFWPAATGYGGRTAGLSLVAHHSGAPSYGLKPGARLAGRSYNRERAGHRKPIDTPLLKVIDLSRYERDKWPATVGPVVRRWSVLAEA